MLELERPRLLVDTGRNEHLEVLVREPSRSELQDCCGRAIEQMDVVDRDEHRLLRREVLQRREERQADDAFSESRVFSRGECEGDLECVPLRLRKLR